VNRSTTEQDAPAVGTTQPVENLDQRALAGAVFSEQRMDFAFPQSQRDVVVRQHTGEALGDALHP
jgi:hypothetical protein